jgi:hypothetical protein
VRRGARAAGGGDGVRMQITLKSGAQIEVDVEDFEIGRPATGGPITRLTWNTPDDWTRKLCNVDIDEIAAIVTVRP